MSDSSRPRGLYISPRDSPGQNTGARILSLLHGIFTTQGSNPGLPHLQADSLSAEPPGKSKNTGVDSLSLLQRIFPTQESNPGLLHCGWILYQLSYQRSPILFKSQLLLCIWNDDATDPSYLDLNLEVLVRSRVSLNSSWSRYLQTGWPVHQCPV